MLILAPLMIEAMALRRGVRAASLDGCSDGAESPSSTGLRTGMGPRAATRMGERVAVLAGGGPVVVAGFCGGLRPEIRTGDVIVANELRGPRGVLSLSMAPGVAEMLRSAGLTVHLGPIVASERVALGGRRARAAADGSLGVDMESYWLLEDCVGRRTQPAGSIAVVRAVSDTAGEALLGGMLPAGWLKAYRSLVRVGARLDGWLDGATLTTVT
jgi:4-hydroxy-3-methylbut-2-enyl diphosphate reductase